MNERSDMIAWLRGEIVGPSRWLTDPQVVLFTDGVFPDATANRRGPLAWQPDPKGDLEEVLYYDRESPHRKYGAALLHPAAATSAAAGTSVSPDVAALQAADTIGADIQDDEVEDASGDDAGGDVADGAEPSEDFEVTSPDVLHPSTVGISFCVRLNPEGCVRVHLPRERRFPWQDHQDQRPFQLNGRYESCKRRWTDERRGQLEAPMWRRHPAVTRDCVVDVHCHELVHGQPVRRDVAVPSESPIRLRVEVFPRRRTNSDEWLLTVVLRNTTPLPEAAQAKHEAVLYQTYFEVRVRDGSLIKYPESQRPFDQLDEEEKSLALLYRESATWGIGHGCAAGWDSEPGQAPGFLFADCLPAVQLPSMTPDIKDENGNLIRLSMRTLSGLPDNGTGPAWNSLKALADEYAAWIERRREELGGVDAPHFAPVGERHLDACADCLRRIQAGITLLRRDQRVRQAFRLANLAMLLQQIASKQLGKRPLAWVESSKRVVPLQPSCSPWQIYSDNSERSDLGVWRAFQIAFLLMSLDGVLNGGSPDREIVDLIWFPTGGGKTEAYLAVMAFYMFHERLLMADGDDGPKRDGTNVLMRYTLRMLTTQQFQRSASLICAMEYLRRNPTQHGIVERIPGERFSLGLWIGGDGSPNKIAEAEAQLRAYREQGANGNPLILTECPWCRAQIGRYDGARPKHIPQRRWNADRTAGISQVRDEGPLLHCSDAGCCYGGEAWQTWLPIEVIDERIYRNPPSLVIGTADKFAMIAFRPDAGSLFGRRFEEGMPEQHWFPPGMIVQDELHLISGPLGTVYALYEGIFERLCSFEDDDGRWIKPKLIASTATIRGAEDQVRALYARPVTRLFPSPGLAMGDSFFGTYARNDDGNLCEGRLYLGIHASAYGSLLTTQVRAYSAVLFRPHLFAEDRRDPWWTLLAFYNSLRELGGAKTLFDSDIRSRLKFVFNREGYPADRRRRLGIVEELTSRLSQVEIVEMMERLSTACSQAADSWTLDACLASNIIEVGVDIDRLSLMGIAGQPKTTATYIQVTGRVGRRWWERAGLILMLYNPSKSRDRSHFEQFHSYHRRLYERVEPNSATPFALSCIQRALPGALIAWARQQSCEAVGAVDAHRHAVDEAMELLRGRCQSVQTPEDVQRSLDELDRVRDELMGKWDLNPQDWEAFPQAPDGEYLMLWPGQYATVAQRRRGVLVPSSMRQVDGSAELWIDQGYADAGPAADVQAGLPRNH